MASVLERTQWLRGLTWMAFVTAAVGWLSRFAAGREHPEMNSMNPVRLVNGSTIYQGRVEVYRHGVWRRICDTDWDRNDAYVVCRQLGYGTAKNATGGSADFPPGSGDYWMDNVGCRGGEDWLAQCPFGGWGEITGCSAGNSAAGVVCQEYDATDDVTIRLEGSSNLFEGRVEVFYSGAWGTICSDNWGLEEAEVACGQLGFDGAQLAADAKLLFGTHISRPVYLSGLGCQGTESNLAQCARDNWLDPGCSGHDNDAGVVCLSPDTPEDGDLRLAGGSTPSAGRVEVYHLGFWGTVCDDDWTESAARVVCRQLGYRDVALAFDLSSDYGHGTGPILLDNVFCTGREHSLVECSHNGWGNHNCDHSEDVAVTCQTDTPAPPSETSSVPMSTIMGIIIACGVIVSCALMILRYLHYRQRAALSLHNNRVTSVESQTPTDSLHRFPRGNSGLFIVNGMPIDPNLPPRDLEPPNYSSSEWKPPEVPQEPPPSYEATVANYPDARTDGVSSPVAPDYFETPLPNVVSILQQNTPHHRHHQEDSLSGCRPTDTPPSSPLPIVD